ncbi:MAG TPA: hypothetical protein VIP11_23330 [Gemmatimonadaceae bacterium]
MSAADARPNELTLRRARSELERASRLAMAGELVPAVTHDLRQPLTAIEMNVSAAIHFLRRPTPAIDDALDALEDALGQQARMRDALQVLQDLAVRREPRRERCDIVALIHEVVTLVKEDAFVRQVSIDVDVPTVVPPITGDATLIRQALLNLLLDALEATSLSAQKHEPVRVTVRPGDTTVEVTVSHVGARAEAAALDDWGLALARSIAEAHGATIALEGTPDTRIRVVTTWGSHAG